MALAGAGRAGQQDVVRPVDEGAVGQLHHEGPVDLRGGAEVELGQRLAGSMPASVTKRAEPRLVAPLQLVVEHDGQELGRGELSLGRLGRAGIQRLQHARQPQRPELGEQRVGHHIRRHLTEELGGPAGEDEAHLGRPSSG